MTLMSLLISHRSGSPKLPLLRWMALSRNRAGLAKLDGHLLKDVGLTQDDAKREASRPFWDVPDHWRG